MIIMKKRITAVLMAVTPTLSPAVPAMAQKCPSVLFTCTVIRVVPLNVRERSNLIIGLSGAEYTVTFNSWSKCWSSG